MGTKIVGLQVTKVVDGDTVYVQYKDKEEKLRLICVDTEESLNGSSKPVTAAGKKASDFAKEYFKSGNNYVKVDIEFDTEESEDICLKKHRGNYGRLLCYIHKAGENYNTLLVREGYSPYFTKYGRSRAYHEEFVNNEREAMSENLIIWNPDTNAGGASREYTTLLPWWSFRANMVDGFRAAIKDGADILSVRLDYDKIAAMAPQKKQATVFCDLQGGVSKWVGGSALVYAGSPQHKFNLWIPDYDNNDAQKIIRLIQNRYGSSGRGYLYIAGKLSDYNGTPQFEMKDIKMISDFAS